MTVVDGHLRAFFFPVYLPSFVFGFGQGAIVPTIRLGPRARTSTPRYSSHLKR